MLENTKTLKEMNEPSPLPEGWAWARLGELGKWTGGGTPSKAIDAFWQNGTIPWVSPKDMKSEFIRDTEDHITEEAVRSSATKFIAAGSILMVMRSGILRHTFPVSVNIDRVTINQDLRALTPAHALNPNFIAHYLRGIQRQILHDCSKDGTTVQSIEASMLEKVLVPIAPLSEQGRVVARIDELFAEISEGEAALERALSALNRWRGGAMLERAMPSRGALRQSILKSAFEGRLVPQDPNEEPASVLLSRLRAEAPPAPRRAHGRKAAP